MCRVLIAATPLEWNYCRIDFENVIGLTFNNKRALFTIVRLAKWESE